MNNAKMWLVVNPSVGVPVFLGAVAVGSFAVHLAVLSKTNWYEDYLIGAPLGDDQVSAVIADPEGELEAAKASFVLPSSDGSMEVTIVNADGTQVKAILLPPTSQTH